MRMSSKQRLLSHRYFLQRCGIDRETEPASYESVGPTAAAKREVFGPQRFRYEMAIIGTFQVANVPNARRKMPAGRRKDRRLSYLTAELIAQAVPLRELCQPQCGNEPTAFRQAQVEQIASLKRHRTLGIHPAAK